MLLTLTAQSQMAEASVQMMRACVLAATRPWTDSIQRGLSLWSEVVLASGGSARDAAALSQVPAAAQDAYSSYRSGGGHASTQVIIAETAAPPQPLNAVAVLGPLYGMLEAWRAALGARQRN